jgi:hypothetical protein
MVLNGEWSYVSVGGLGITVHLCSAAQLTKAACMKLSIMEVRSMLTPLLIRMLLKVA